MAYVGCMGRNVSNSPPLNKDPDVRYTQRHMADDVAKKLVDIYKRFKHDLVTIRHEEFQALEQVGHAIDEKRAAELRARLQQRSGG